MITGVVITYNVEDHIRLCIQSIKQVCSEILVIDAYSTDQTLEIAQKEGVRIIQRTWNGYGNAKNFGADHASNDWILSIDADEKIDQKMVEFLSSLEPQKEEVYSFRRVNFTNTRQIKYGVFKPEWKKRLYHRDYAKWDDSLVHEQLIHTNTHTIKKGVGAIEHRPFKDIRVLKEKWKRYSKLSAQEWLRSGLEPNPLLKSLAPLYHFIRTFLIHGGILEGKLGFELSKAFAQYQWDKYQYYKLTTRS